MLTQLNNPDKKKTQKNMGCYTNSAELISRMVSGFLSDNQLTREYNKYRQNKCLIRNSKSDWNSFYFCYSPRCSVYNVLEDMKTLRTNIL